MRWAGGWQRRRLARAIPHIIGKLAFVLAALSLAPGRVAAQDGQFGVRVATESDLRWRGYTLSAGHPVLSFNVNYDDLSGFYLNGSGLAEWRGGDPRTLGFDVSGGYSARLSSRLSLDVGAEHAHYRAAYPGGFVYGYTQIYAGLTRGPVLARISYSPIYFARKVQTLYFEAESGLRLPASLRLSAHAGVLVVLDQPPPPSRYRPTQADWRIGVSRPFGDAEVHLTLSGGGPSHQYYEGGFHRRTVLTAGASISF